jgi:flagellar biosynthesis protein FliQ
MPAVILELFQSAVDTTVLIVLPIVAGVAGVGIVVGMLQTIVQVQDQNVSFAPKFIAVAIAATLFGPAAFSLLVSLMTKVIASLSIVARA